MKHIASYYLHGCYLLTVHVVNNINLIIIYFLLFLSKECLFQLLLRVHKVLPYAGLIQTLYNVVNQLSSFVVCASKWSGNFYEYLCFSVDMVQLADVDLLLDPCLFSFIFEQSAILKDSSISINRVTWSSDGSLIGKSPLVSIRLF